MTIVVVVLVVTAAAALATVVNRRSPDVPTAPQFATPQQLDRSDFDHRDADWLFVLFSSATCLSCIDARDALAGVAAAGVAMQDVDVETQRPLHHRYDIDAVPTLVLTDQEGVVRWSYLGAPPADALVEVLTDLGAISPPEADGTAVQFP